MVSAGGAGSIKVSSMGPIDLLATNVQGRVEKKNGLSYLSWAWAWAEALHADPNASFNVQMFEGKPYMEINGTAMVWVTVTMFGKSLTCFLPVMNGANKPITFEGREIQLRSGGKMIEKIDSFNVNTAIMRCLTKGLALHGLGLNIYAGEDLPMVEEKTAPASEAPVALAVVKAEPKPEPKAEAKAEPKTAAPTAQETANAELFTDAIHEYMKLCHSDKDLRSYWKENQHTLDALKVSHPALYEGILAAFKEKAASLPKEKANGD